MSERRAAIYARVSKAGKGGKTASVDEQVADLKALLGDDAVVYADRAIKASGSRKARPEWERLLTDIEAGKVGVVGLWEVSRASRRLVEWAEFRDICARKGVRWVTADGVEHDPAKDRLGLGVKAVVAEEETEQLSQRVRRTVRQRATEGRPHGRDIFGYRRLYSPTTGALETVVEEPVEAAVVRRVFAEVVGRKPLRAIARDLNEEGVLCPSAAIAARRGREIGERRWTGRQVSDMVRRRAYLGVREHRISDRYDQHQVTDVAQYPACWPALVNEATWDAANAVLSDPSRWTRPDDSQPVKHYLTGLLRCGKCHSAMRVERGTYYCCSDSRCRGATVNKEAVEELIGEVVQRRIADIEALEAALDAEDGPATPGLDQAAIAGRRADLGQLFATGAISLAAFAEAEKSLVEQERALAAAREEVAPEALIAWADGTPAQKRDAARYLIDSIIVSPMGRTGRPKKGEPKVPLERLEVRWK